MPLRTLRTSQALRVLTTLRALTTLRTLRPWRRLPGTGRRRGLAVICVAAFATVIATAAPASAHAELVGSTPAGGAVIGGEPPRVTLRFSEEIVLRLSAVKVIGPDGRRLETGSLLAGPSGGDSLAVGLAPDTRRGTFVVEWQVTAADDGHASSGDFMFSVGSPSLAAVPVSAPGGDRVTTAVSDAAQWTGFAGLALVGGFAMVRPRRTPGRTEDAGRAEDSGSSAGPGSTWPAALGWALLLAGTLVQLATYAPSSRGLSLGHVLDRPLLSATLATRAGHALMARLVLLALAAVVGDAVLRRARGPAVPIVFTLGIAATWGVTGHAATGSAVPLAVAALTLHVAAMALWVGGLFTVAVLLAGRDADGAPVAAAVARFSRLALAAVGVLVATGGYQAWREAGGLRALTDTPYGRLLLAKVAVLLVVVAVARRSRGIVARRRTGSADVLRRGVMVELAGAAVLLLLAVLLAGNAPAREAAGGGPGSKAVACGFCDGGAASTHG